MNKKDVLKINIIASITIFIMLLAFFLFNSNAADENAFPPPIVDENTTPTDPEPEPTPEPEQPDQSESDPNPGEGQEQPPVPDLNTTPSTDSGNGGNSSSGSQPSSSSNPSRNNNSNSPSSNANLVNLGIRPHDFSGFRSDTTSYSVTVPADTESVEVYAQTQDSNSTVTGTGTVNLQEGENTIEVVVTAQDGTTKTYTIVITREVSEDAEAGTELIEGEGLLKLNIQGAELSPEFNTNTYEYTAKYIGERTSLPIEVEATNETYKIEIVGNEELKEGENLITILVSDSEGNNVATYQITVNKSLVDEEALAREQEEQEKKQKTMVGAIIAVIVVVAIIVFVVIKRKRNRAFAEEYSGVPFYGMNKDDYEEDYEEKPKALRKKKAFVEDEEDTLDDKYENDMYNYENDYDDFEDEEKEYEKENKKIMSRLQEDEEERARRERVKAKFLEGYSKNMTDIGENNSSRTYNKFDDEDDFDDKAEAFASRVKRNSKGRRFKE